MSQIAEASLSPIHSTIIKLDPDEYEKNSAPYYASVFLANYNELQQKRLSELSSLIMELPGINKNRVKDIARSAALMVYNQLHENAHVSYDSPLDDQKRAFAFYQAQKAIMKQGYTDHKATTKGKGRLQMCLIGKVKDTAHHKARVDVDLYQSSKTDPLSTFVALPTAMPVDISSLEDLQDFFTALNSNQPARGEKTDWIGTYDQYKRGAYYTDGRIDLCKQVVGPDHIQALMESITMNSNVTHFLLGNNIINKTGAQAIADFINNKSKASHISTWYLAGNAFDEEATEILAQSLEEDVDCEQLWLKRNPINVRGALAIAKMLRKNKHIKVLDLDNTAILDEGCIAIFDALKENDTLETLYLDANGITKKSIPAMMSYFLHKLETAQNGIKRLAIGMNRLEDAICSLMLCLKNYPMLSLGLDSNRIELVGLKCILENIPPTLLSLDIGYYKATADMGELPNSFGDLGAKLIADFLFTNPPLLALSVDNTHITHDGLGLIGAAMAFNSNLIHLSYGQGGILDEMKGHSRENGKTIMRHYRLNASKHNFASEEEFKLHLRHLKHGKDIWVIDSIYRNKM